jgi:hypothetical protein
LGDQIKENEMSGACGTDTGEKINVYWFWWENLNYKRILGNLGVGGS